PRYGVHRREWDAIDVVVSDMRVGVMGAMSRKLQHDPFRRPRGYDDGPGELVLIRGRERRDSRSMALQQRKMDVLAQQDRVADDHIAEKSRRPHLEESRPGERDHDGI